MDLTPFQTNYLHEYFNSLTDEKRTELLVDFFQELQYQELVSCPMEDDLEEDADLLPYWCHTGEPLG